MPSRWACLLIFVLWLASMGWLFQREIWPLLQPDIPPPYTIDLVDEARQQHQAEIHWSVYLEKDRPPPRPIEIRATTSVALLGLGSDLNVGAACAASSQYTLANQRQSFQARTSVRYEERPDDLFLFKMDLLPSGTSQRQLDLGTFGPLAAKLDRMESHYRVNRLGQLQAMEVKFKAEVTFHILGTQTTIKDLQAEMDGQVVDGKFQGHYKIVPGNLPLSQENLNRFQLQGDIKPVPLSYNGSVLLPYHPVNRIRGLHPGQKWRVPLVNPVQEALLSFLGGSQKARLIDAHVLPQPQYLPDSEEAIRCLVIEYDYEELQPRTWVRQSTGLVLRQEAVVSGGQRLIIQRETIPREP